MGAGHWAIFLTMGELSGVATAQVFVVFRLMALKLMWQSGLCKLATGDTSWATATAMDYHFLTQPLPSPAAYSAHRVMQKTPFLSRTLSVLGVLGEMILSLLPLFVVWWARVTGFILLVLLVLGIAATGNYGFLHVLTVSILTSFLSDDVLLWGSDSQKSWPAAPVQWALFCVIFIKS